MKSRLFTDPQGLDEPFGLCAPDKVSVCVQMDREAYRHALERAASPSPIAILPAFPA